MVRSVSKVTIKIHAINHAAIKNCQPDGARSAVGMNMKNFFLARLIKKKLCESRSLEVEESMASSQLLVNELPCR